MAAASKVVAIGNNLGILIPEEVLSRLRFENGDTVYLTEDAGDLRVSLRDERDSRIAEAADRVIRKYDETLKKLAE